MYLLTVLDSSLALCGRSFYHSLSFPPRHIPSTSEFSVSSTFSLCLLCRPNMMSCCHLSVYMLHAEVYTDSRHLMAKFSELTWSDYNAHFYQSDTFLFMNYYLYIKYIPIYVKFIFMYIKIYSYLCTYLCTYLKEVNKPKSWKVAHRENCNPGSIISWTQ